MRSWGYPRYVTVAEKRARAEKKLKQLAKKNPGIRPVILQGSAIATTWWGKSWNHNLERYADYGNRIERGRSYVRHNAVLDLQISPGKVNALVQGSASRPYSVAIGIKPIASPIWKAMIEACKGKMASLQAFLTGKFPKELQEVFMAKGKGLFPSPAEIQLSCSCPDWAVMCKHVAAVLYGIGARLDEDPNLFFMLRKADVNALISTAVTEQTHTLLTKAEKKSRRVMETTDLSEIFGIDLSEDGGAVSEKPPAAKTGKVVKKPKIKASPISSSPRTRKTRAAAAKPKPSAGRKKTVQKSAKTTSVKPRRKASSKKPPAQKSPSLKAIQPAGQSAYAWVEVLIQESGKGIGIPELVERTGFDRKKIHNIIFRLKRMQKIKNVSRGVFTGIA